MKFAKSALKFLVSPALGVAGVLSSKKKAPVQALPGATRDDAQAMIDQQDELRRRKGGAADILTGFSGAEAALANGRMVLGS